MKTKEQLRAKEEELEKVQSKQTTKVTSFIHHLIFGINIIALIIIIIILYCYHYYYS